MDFQNTCHQCVRSTMDEDYQQRPKYSSNLSVISIYSTCMIEKQIQPTRSGKLVTAMRLLMNSAEMSQEITRI